MTLTRSFLPSVSAVWAVLAVILFLTIVPVTSAEDKRGAGTATDQRLFPKAYGILANEKLMYPVDMSEWPVKIDSTHQLFIDDYACALRTRPPEHSGYLPFSASVAITERTERTANVLF